MIKDFSGSLFINSGTTFKAHSGIEGSKHLSQYVGDDSAYKARGIKA